MINVIVVLMIISTLGVVSSNIIFSNISREGMKVKYTDLNDLSLEQDSITCVNTILRNDNSKLEELFKNEKLCCNEQGIIIYFISDRQLIKIECNGVKEEVLLKYCYKDNKILLFPYNDRY